MGVLDGKVCHGSFKGYRHRGAKVFRRHTLEMEPAASARYLMWTPPPPGFLALIPRTGRGQNYAVHRCNANGLRHKLITQAVYREKV